MARHVKIVNRVRGWCAIEIPRCGCTGLKHRAWIDAHGHEYDHVSEGIDLHRRLGYSAETSGGLVVEWDHDTAGLYHFAVWRDPISRCVSTWKAFTQEETLHPNFEKMAGCDFAEWIDYCLYSLREHGAYVDPHIRPQSMFFCESDVSAIVPIDLLDSFLSYRFNYSHRPHANSSEKIDTIGNPEASPEDMERFVERYAADYTIPYSKKFLKG